MLNRAARLTAPRCWRLQANSNNLGTRRLTTKTGTAPPPDEIPKPVLRALFLASAIPMLGFGIMDNLIMIQAGDYIDKTFGAKLGITTLAAAAMGQVFSDVSGVLFGGTVETFAVKMGFKVPRLGKGQAQLPAARR